MGKFKAADAVDPLEYDFRPYSDAQGTVPEPSDKAVAAFYVGLANALKGGLGEDRLDGVDLKDPQQLAQLMSELTTDDMAAMNDHMLDLHAAVCSNEPSRDDLTILPYRVRQAWYGMVQGWLRPEGSRLAGNA